MRTEELLLSGLDITEDEYHFKAQFILSAQGKSVNVDLEALEQESELQKLKALFNLEESTGEIRQKLMDMVMEKAKIGSKIVEGENYNDKK